MKETNKTKQQIILPEGYFTIKQIQELNPKMINITLRFKLNETISKNEVVSIGKKKNDTNMGRPTLVFVRKDKVTSEILEAAKKNNVILDEKYEIMVTKIVAEISNTNPTQPVLTEKYTESYVDDESLVETANLVS